MPHTCHVSEVQGTEVHTIGEQEQSKESTTSQPQSQLQHSVVWQMSRLWISHVNCSHIICLDHGLAQRREAVTCSQTWIIHEGLPSHAYMMYSVSNSNDDC